MTIGELYGPAMEIQTQKEADAYFEKLVSQHLAGAPGHARDYAESVQRSNLGYYAGYYSDETRQRVERLFHCAHPIFGSIAKKGPPTPEEALALGVKAGEAAKRHNQTRRPL